MSVERRIDGPAHARATLILAHGAGQDMDSPFMQTLAGRIAESGIRVVRFNFPYMTRAKADGRRRPPDRQAVLLEAFRAVIDAERNELGALFIGGKSLGGRMASLIADDIGATGLVCLGYPFHPPGRPERLRTAHLEGLRTPALMCQGERDTFGNKDEVGDYALSESIRFHWLADGDHGFKPRKASGRTEAQNLEEAAQTVIRFVGHTIGED